MSHHFHDSGESLDVSICHTISNMTSPSICQSHDLSVCELKHDSIWNSIHHSVCPSSVLSIQPSTVKMPKSIAGHNFLKGQFTGKFLSIHASSDSSVNPSGSPSVTPSLSAENPSKIPGNNGEKHTVNHLHESLVKIPTVHSSSVMSVIAPVSACPCQPSMSDVEHQEISDECDANPMRT